LFAPLLFLIRSGAMSLRVLLAVLLLAAALPGTLAQ